MQTYFLASFRFSSFNFRRLPNFVLTVLQHLSVVSLLEPGGHLGGVGSRWSKLLAHLQLLSNALFSLQLLSNALAFFRLRYARLCLPSLRGASVNMTSVYVDSEHCLRSY